jgi:hypothetical protein
MNTSPRPTRALDDVRGGHSDLTAQALGVGACVGQNARMTLSERALMAALTEVHKRLIVQRLATFHSPSEIADELQDMGVVVSLSQIATTTPNPRPTISPRSGGICTARRAPPS